MAQQVKNPPAVQETQETRVPSLGREDPMEKEMATHSRILAWRIPWTEESDRLQFMGSQTVGQDWACTQKVNKGENNQDNKCELALPWCLGENPWGLWKTRDCPREEGCLFNSSWSLLLGDLSSRWPDLQSPFFVLLFFFFKEKLLFRCWVGIPQPADEIQPSTCFHKVLLGDSQTLLLTGC